MGKKIAKTAGIVALTCSLSLGCIVLPASAADGKDKATAQRARPTTPDAGGRGWQGPRDADTRPKDCIEKKTGRPVPCPQSMAPRQQR